MVTRIAESAASPEPPRGEEPGAGGDRGHAAAAARAIPQRVLRALTMVVLAAAICVAFAGVLRNG